MEQDRRGIYSQCSEMKQYTFGLNGEIHNKTPFKTFLHRKIVQETNQITYVMRTAEQLKNIRNFTYFFL